MPKIKHTVTRKDRFNDATTTSEEMTVFGWCVYGFALLLAVVVLVFAVLGIGKTYSRHQKLADANNRVKVTSINIRNAEQQARVVHAQNDTIKAKAEQRVITAIGIRKAQDHIAATLTDKYLQWEAIEAQKAAANSPNHTQVYIPSGANGVPLVKTVP